MSDPTPASESSDARPDGTTPTPPPPSFEALDRTFWSRVGDGLVVAGRAVGRAASTVGRSLASAYRAVDPDVRRHVVQLPLFGLTMLAPRRARIEPLPDDGFRPVVFVHGLAGHRGNFLPMQTYFRLVGRARSYAAAFEPERPLHEVAEELRAFFDEIVRVNALPDDAKIDVVAHSMGGLLVRLALEDPRTAARIGTLVTLGTPHEGTHAARYASTLQSRELRPDSPTMARLRAQIPWAGPPAMPRLVACWSAADMLLLPATSARVEGAENVELTGFTHMSYLLDPSGWRRVARLLER